MCEEAESAQAIVGRHHHHALPLGDSAGIVLHVVADGEAAAVDPDHHRPRTGRVRVAGRVDVQRQAIFRSGTRAQDRALHAHRPRLRRIAHAGPGRSRFGGLEPQGAHGRRSEGNSQKRLTLRRRYAPHRPRRRFDDEGPRARRRHEVADVARPKRARGQAQGRRDHRKNSPGFLHRSYPGPEVCADEDRSGTGRSPRPSGNHRPAASRIDSPGDSASGEIGGAPGAMDRSGARIHRVPRWDRVRDPIDLGSLESARSMSPGLLPAARARDGGIPPAAR